MDRLKRNDFIKSGIAILLTVTIIVICIMPRTVKIIDDNTPLAAFAEGEYVENIRFQDFSSWKTGHYSLSSGAYQSYPTRICLSNYVRFGNSKYIVNITDKNYNMLIRELDVNKKFIKSSNLTAGSTFIPVSNAKYLAIGIYRASGESGITYNTYKTLFSNGFIAKLTVVQNTNEQTEDKKTDTITSTTIIKSYSVENIDFANITNWRSGHYSLQTGLYQSYSTRVCLIDYVTFADSQYKVSITDKNYNMLIRELDSNKKFIKSNNLPSGSTFTPTTNTKYLAIGIYRSAGESGITYNTYKTMFANGFVAKLTPAKEEVKAEEPKVETTKTEEPSKEIVENSSPDYYAGMTAGEKEVIAILGRLLVNNSSEKVDISKYGISLNRVNQLWRYAIGEHIIEFCASDAIISSYVNSNKIVTAVSLAGTDSSYSTKLTEVRKVVNEYVKMTNPSMSDLDKILLAHEFIVDKVSYSNVNNCDFKGYGALLYNKAACYGYAYAMRALLTTVGIECTNATSSQMNHEWLLVKADGQWYHIDATWDRTRKSADGTYFHRYLLRNDNEFMNVLSGRHYGWVLDTVQTDCKSEKLTKWFVHDVAGRMYYANGRWYYFDKASRTIKASDIYGNNQETIVSGITDSGTVKLSGISNGVLTYYVGSQKYTKIL